MSVTTNLTGPQVARSGSFVSCSATVVITADTGLTDRVELGARVWLPGVALEGKVALLRSDSPEEGFDVSLAPSLGWMGIVFSSDTGDDSGLHVVTVSLPLLFGWSLGGGEEEEPASCPEPAPCDSVDRSG